MTKYIFRRQIDVRFKIQNDVKGSVVLSQYFRNTNIYIFSDLVYAILF